MSVQTLIDGFLPELRKIGLKEQTIRRNYICFYRSLCKKSGDRELDENLIRTFFTNTLGKDIWNLPYYQLSRWERSCTHAFRLLLEYQEHGLVKALPRGKEQLLEVKDKTALDTYLSFCVEAQNAEKTCERKRAAIKRFLAVYHPLASVDVSAIHSYIHSFVGKSTYYQKRELDEIQKFLAFCFVYGYITDDYSVAFPDVRAVKDSKLPSVYTDAEIKLLLKYMAEHGSVNKKRNYAIALLIAVYGIRSADISGLKCSSLDFGNGTIRFSQSKTGVTLIHRLLPHVGNAVVSYILEERPSSCSDLLFLKTDGTSLSPKSVSSVIRNAFLSSGVDIGRRKYGAHSLRHSLATGMINDGCSIFTVAKVLGQTSAETARLYAKVDISRLLYCALEVPSNE